MLTGLVVVILCVSPWRPGRDFAMSFCSHTNDLPTLVNAEYGQTMEIDVHYLLMVKEWAIVVH